MNNKIMEFYLLLIIAVAFLVLIQVFLVWRRRKQISKRDIALAVSEWNSIREKVSREPKHALIEADKLLDFVLKKRGYTGSLADKMKSAEKVFSHADDLWRAHKLRNRSVHEIGFEISEQQARRAISFYKQALWDLGIKIV